VRSCVVSWLFPFLHADFPMCFFWEGEDGECAVRRSRDLRFLWRAVHLCFSEWVAVPYINFNGMRSSDTLISHDVMMFLDTGLSSIYKLFPHPSTHLEEVIVN